MKILLDSTYLFPAINVAFEKISLESIYELVSKGHEVFISEISFFELSAKGAKYVCSGQLQPGQVTRGIEVLMRDRSIKKIPVYENKIILNAIRIRNNHRDFIDCLILSTAINNCDVLVTEDHEIHAQKENPEYCELLSEVNPKFKIQKINELGR